MVKFPESEALFEQWLRTVFHENMCVINELILEKSRKFFEYLKSAKSNNKKLT